MAKVLIAGLGDVGARLAARLVADGHEVIGLRRSPFAQPGVVPLLADVRDPATLALPDGLDAVFIILAPAAADTGAAGGEAAYRATYHDGTAHVLAALAGQSLRRVFWVSSTSVYGQDDGSWVDEASPATPASATGRVLLASEALVQAAPWPATVVRFSGLYGPGRLRLVRWVEDGRPVQAAPPAWSNRLHVEDAAGLLAFLFAHCLAGTELEGLYIGTDDAPAPQHEVLDWLAARRGLPPVPRLAPSTAGSNKRLSNRRLQALGFRCRYPDYRAGYADVMGLSDDFR